MTARPDPETPPDLTASELHSLAGLERVGDFEIVREIGRGSMGVVFEAIQRPLERRVALKVLYTEGKSDKAIERFRREAAAAGRLDHPGIVPVWAVGEAEGLLYYAMQLVEGPTLKELIHSGEPLDPARAALITLRIAQALDYAHREGIVHRDIKPANIIVTEGDRPVITDFGLAKVLALGQLTQAGAVLGTPTHLSPEQARGETDIDHRADIYGLGVCLYEMLTRRLPFEADDLETLLRKILRERPVPPRRRVPGLPRALDAITMRCLARKRADRYGSAAELAADLERYLRGESVAGAGGLTRSWRRLARPLARAGIGGVLLLAAAAAGWWLQGRNTPAPGPSTPAAATRAPISATTTAPPAPSARPTRGPDPSAAERAQRWLTEAQRAASEAREQQGAQALVAEQRALERYAQVLALEPDSRTARLGRARIFAERALRAERRGLAAEARAYEQLARALDPTGALAALFDPTATLMLATRPVPARVRLERVVIDPKTGLERREPLREGLTSPWGPERLPVGSYVLQIEAQGFAPLEVPVLLERGAEVVLELRLLRPEQIPTGFVYVPAGPFVYGGDPEAVRAGPRRVVTLDGYLIAEREVTVASYAAFLDALPMREARASCPRGGGRHGAAALFWPGEDGHWRYPPSWSPDRPVAGVPFSAAEAYARWAARRTGRPLRLPTELEWEKAGRGADGRPYPWGSADPIGRARLPEGPAPVEPVPVASTVTDVSVYGVYDLVGNVREWTSSRHDPSGRLPHRVVRGAGFLPLPDPPRLAARRPELPAPGPPDVGLRLACDLPPE